MPRIEFAFLKKDDGYLLLVFFFFEGIACRMAAVNEAKTVSSPEVGLHAKKMESIRRSLLYLKHSADCGDCRGDNLLDSAMNRAVCVAGSLFISILLCWTRQIGLAVPVAARAK